MIRSGVVLLVLVTGLPLQADGDRDARARAHYEVGLGMYHLGNYRDAAREFSAGYELSPRPQFLINLGQAYRKLQDLDRALEMFHKYLETAPADSPDRKQVRALIDEVERERAAAPPPPPAPAPAPAPAVAAPAVALVAAPAAPSRRSAIRRYWWTIPVGAVLVGAAVGLTVYFTQPPSQLSCKSATIACLDLRN